MIDVLLVSTDEEVKVVFETLEKRGVLRFRSAPNLAIAQYGIELATPDCTFVHGRVSGMSIDVLVQDLQQILPEDANYAFLVDDPFEKAQAQQCGVRFMDLSLGTESLKASIEDVLGEIASSKRVIEIQDEEDDVKEWEVAGEPVAQEREEFRAENGYADPLPQMDIPRAVPVASAYDQIYDRVNLGAVPSDSVRRYPTVRELLEQEEAFAHRVRRPKRDRYASWIPIVSAVILVPIIFYLFEVISTNRNRVVSQAPHPKAQAPISKAAGSVPRISNGVASLR